MSEFDTRKLIDTTLPALASQIAPLIAPIGEGTDWRTPQQSSWRTQADLSRLFFRQVDKSGDGYVYIYSPYRKENAPVYNFGGRNPEIATECQIKFYNLRVVDIIDRQYGALNQSPAGPGRSSTKRIPNDSSEPLEKNLSHTDRQWTEWGESLSLLLEAEIEQTVTAGSAAYGVESETKLRVRSEVDKESSEGGGSETTDTDESKTTIKPFHALEIVTTRQPVNINQDVTVTGTLECDIDLVLDQCYGEACIGFNAMMNVFRGIGAGNDRVRDWFANPNHTVAEAVLKEIERPTVTLNIGLRGVQGQSVEQSFRQRPIEKLEKGKDS